MIRNTELLHMLENIDSDGGMTTTRNDRLELLKVSVFVLYLMPMNHAGGGCDTVARLQSSVVYAFRSTLPHNNELAIKTHLLNHLLFNNENKNKTKAKSRKKEREREENNKIIESRASRRAHACSRVVASIVDINDKLVDALNSRCSHSAQSHEFSE